MEWIFYLAVATFLLWIGYHITGAVLSAILWLTIRLPLSVFLFGTGLALCITILFFPVGKRCLRSAWRLLF